MQSSCAAVPHVQHPACGNVLHGSWAAAPAAQQQQDCTSTAATPPLPSQPASAQRTLVNHCTIVSSGSGAKLTRRRSFLAGRFFCCFLEAEPSRPPAAARFLAACAGREEGGICRDGSAPSPRRQAAGGGGLSSRRQGGRGGAGAHRAAGAVLLGWRGHGCRAAACPSPSCLSSATVCRPHWGAIRAGQLRAALCGGWMWRGEASKSRKSATKLAPRSRAQHGEGRGVQRRLQARPCVLDTIHSPGREQPGPLARPPHPAPHCRAHPLPRSPIAPPAPQLIAPSAGAAARACPDPHAPPRVVRRR